MVLLSGVVRDLSEAIPHARIIVFAGADNAEMAALIPGVAEVVTLPLTRPWRSLPRIRRQKLDALLDCGPWSRIEALYAALSGARFTVGFSRKGQHRHYCYDIAVPHSDDFHEVDHYRHLAEVLGVTQRRDPSVSPPGVLAQDELPERPYVVFHLWPSGYRSELKEWPAQSWRRLAAGVSRAGFQIVLTGSPADASKSAEVAEQCRGLNLPVVSTAGRLAMPEVVDLLCASSCVVSVNTGIMHVAAAAGVPTVCLNGPTSDARWGPLAESAISLNSSLDGCGYLSLGSEYAGQRRDCMRGICVERVAGAVFEAIASTSGAPLEEAGIGAP
jgi:ADP-heptose:LPS heptosyltransferase